MASVVIAGMAVIVLAYFLLYFFVATRVHRPVYHFLDVRKVVIKFLELV